MESRGEAGGCFEALDLTNDERRARPALDRAKRFKRGEKRKLNRCSLWYACVLEHTRAVVSCANECCRTDAPEKALCMTCISQDGAPLEVIIMPGRPLSVV